MHNPEDRCACLIPKPTAVKFSPGDFVISTNAKILIPKDHRETLAPHAHRPGWSVPGSAGVALIRVLLTAYLRQGNSFEVAVVEEDSDLQQRNICLVLNGDVALGEV